MFLRQADHPAASVEHHKGQDQPERFLCVEQGIFSQYLDGANLDSRQIYFVNQIVEYIVHNGTMKDLSVLQEPPFTDQGSIVEVFTDLSIWLGIRKTIEQVNANAIAA